MSKCIGCLTIRAINTLNEDFAGINPYSKTQNDWRKYSARFKKLKARLDRHIYDNTPEPEINDEVECHRPDGSIIEWDETDAPHYF